MYQTLFHIPETLFGLPVFGVGVLLVVWLAACGAYLVWFARQEGLGPEFWGQAPLMLVLAAVIVFLFPRMSDGQGLPIRGFGAMVVLAVVAGAGLALSRARYYGLSQELVTSAAMWIFVPAVVGARLFYVAQYWAEFRGSTWRETLFNALKVTEGGLVVYGAVLGGFVGLLTLVLRRGAPLAPLLDLAAPSAALAMGLGRLGCFLNGCCFGGPSDLPWAVTFPYGSPPYEYQARRGEATLLGLALVDDLHGRAEIARVEPGSPADDAGLRPGHEIARLGARAVYDARDARGVLLSVRTPGAIVEVQVAGEPDPRRLVVPTELPRSRPVHPSQLYSAIDGLLLAAFLLAYAPYRRAPGALFALFVSIYAVTRFLVEMVRTDESSFLGTGLTISQNVSILMLAAGLLGMIYARVTHAHASAAHAAR